MKVLIVDDSRAMRRILKKIMAGFTSQIVEAADGQQALDQITRERDFDLVLVDWNMPVMDGLELVKIVRQNRAFDKIKLVMVTTEAEPIRMAKALMSGVDEFVMKPFTKEVLVDKLRLIGVNLPISVS